MTSRGIRTLVFSTVFLWTTLSWALPLSLDQFYIPASDPREGVVIEVTETVAQTFTIGVGGLLTAVEIELRCCQHGTPLPTCSLRSVQRWLTALHLTMCLQPQCCVRNIFPLTHSSSYGSVSRPTGSSYYLVRCTRSC